MRPARLRFVGSLITGIALAGIFSAGTATARQAETYSQVWTAPVAVPRLMQFSGTLKDTQGKPLAGVVPITFAIYAAQQDNTPLWIETQDISFEPGGSYTALLGAGSHAGLPAELFAKGEARWLGIQAPEQPELPRILLVSVPYAMKAADADTLGGLPASAFLTAAGSAARPAAPQLSTVLTLPQITNGLSAATTGTGTTNFIPLWTSSTNLGNSILFQSSGNLQVNGGLQLPQTGTATATAGFSSRPMDLFASSFSSSSQTAIVQHFRWQAEAMGNNTSTASGRVNLLYAPGVGTPAETGLSITSKGILTFAPGQTLPAVTGNETVSGSVSATQLISTLASGTAPLKVTSTTQVSNLNASLLGGLSAGAFALRGAPNTFLGTQSVSGALNVTGSINSALVLQGSVTHGGVTSANVIAGFAGNAVTNSATGATIGGGGTSGKPNIVSDDFATIGGGDVNTAGKGDGTGPYATVGGGVGNTASGLGSTVAGGNGNTASNFYSNVAGGIFNLASAQYSTVAGGDGNTASGDNSTVAGGISNTATGSSSFAAGNNAHASASGSFVWCQYDGNPCDSGPRTNTFLVAVDGPIFMFDGFNGQGCYLNPGTAGWQCSSDRNLKNNIRPIQSRSVLEGVAHMPISQWSMKSDTTGRNHIGPMAQDFYATFGLGDSDKYIGQGDAQGVALASIQGLYQLVQDKDEQIRSLQTKLESLEARIARFESALANVHQ